MKPMKAWAIVMKDGEVRALSDRMPILYRTRREAKLSLWFRKGCKAIKVVITEATNGK